MKSHALPASRGFALVSVLMMMVLLSLLALGLLGLSTIQMRTSAQSGPQQRARANARIGLMLALGQLQEHLGPDQRVCADGRVMGTPTTALPTHPHWVSVWKTNQDNGTPWIARNGEKGGLFDQRKTLKWEAAKRRTTCLVSGNESGIVFTEDGSAGSGNLVGMVEEGSLGKGAGNAEIVMAPRVGIGPSSKPSGGYAWWVGDLGAKANVATPDGAVTRANSRYLSQMLAQDSSWMAFGNKELETRQRELLVDEPQISLVEPGMKDRHFHDLTVWSAGLPINVAEGGWRRDLTAYLESAGSIPETVLGEARLLGLSDSDNLVGPANSRADFLSANPGQAKRFTNVSPNFGLLRTWARRAQSSPLGSLSLDQEIGEMANEDTGGRSSRSVDFEKRTTSHVMPTLAEGSLYYNLSYYQPTTPAATNPYAMRVHFYPRVALWNPYNFTLNLPESAIFMQINGSKSVEVTMQGERSQRFRMFWGLGNSSTGGSVRGSMFFKLDAAKLKPGETLVWSPASNLPYDEANFGNNRLSPTVAPSPARSFYQDRRSDGFPLFAPQPATSGFVNNLLPLPPVEWREIVPPKPAGNIQSVAYTQADDYLMSWKPLTGSSFDLSSFSNLPMGRFVSCAYQYGDEDELPVEWTSLDPVPFPKSSLTNPIVNLVPDRRTRDGFRLRWFDEPVSNVIGSGSLAGKPHLEDSAIGNWNLRASWSFRNPYENVTDVAPNFFGIYTRDLFDGEVDWSSMAPRASGGVQAGDPFDQPIRSGTPRILFDVPRKGTEIASLAAFQHVNFSEFIWHPTYALGNSLADPRIGRKGTEPDRSRKIVRDFGGWNKESIGYSTDGRSDTNGATNRSNEENWAYHARDFLHQVPTDQNVIYDLSYELNHSLWDAYFLSSGSAADKAALLKDGSPLPNGRMMVNRMGEAVTESTLKDFHRAASGLLINGAFNVNSASVEAWESLLLSAAGTQSAAGEVAFPRILDAPGGTWDGSKPKSTAAWTGQRVFKRAEIRRLAEQIVAEVRSRGPFLSLADFVNRRLSEDETGKKGALQAAIDKAELNSSLVSEWPLNNRVTLPDYRHVDHITDPTSLDQTLKPNTSAWGGLGFLTQADLLQFIGPALSARSDTFRIRAYGESLDGDGKVEARVWCEAVVQRSPKFVDGADNMMEAPATLGSINKKFGRRFEIVSFRWLSPEEI